jgi:predicted lipoprotein with Yx(FWY)xxD motif
MNRLVVSGLLPAAAVAFAVAGCGGGSNSTGGMPTTGASAAAPPAAPAPSPAPMTIAARKGSVGTYLVDGQGRTLYLFEADKGMSSTCYGACATAWPPITTSGAPSAGPGIDASKLGTTRRNDGTLEATYGGHPLYYFRRDAQPGATTGQGINAFGAKWYVLAPSGEKIDTD